MLNFSSFSMLVQTVGAARRRASRLSLAGLHLLLIVALIAPSLSAAADSPAPSGVSVQGVRRLWRAEAGQLKYAAPVYTHPEPRTGSRPFQPRPVTFGLERSSAVGLADPHAHCHTYPHAD